MKIQMNNFKGTQLAATIVLLLLCVSPCISQNIISSNLIWVTDQASDLQNNTTTAYNAKFKTNANQSVEWIQRNGQMSTRYDVTGTDGNWQDVSKPGSITYLLTRNGKPVKMILEKNASGIFITLDFSVPGQVASLQKFHVQSVQPEN